MGIGKASDFKIYPEEYYSGQIEVLAGNLDVFNSASRGAIALDARSILGDYEKRSFIEDTADLVSRRDTTSVAAVDDLKITGDEIVSVKLNRKIGPVAHTLDAWRKMGKTNEEASLVFGRQAGRSKLKNHIDSAIRSLVAAILAQTSLVEDDSAGTIAHTGLVDALARFGDGADNIVAWVMHSKQYFDLVKKDISEKITNVASTTIYGGSPASLGRPCIVSDIDALIVDGTPDAYLCLGLVPMAAQVVESESEVVETDLVSGLANLVYRVQGEYAINLELKGYKWDVADGGANPTDSALATGTNWEKIASSDKNTAGVILKTQ